MTKPSRTIVWVFFGGVPSRQCWTRRFPVRWQYETRQKYEKKKNGWNRTSSRPCGHIPRSLCDGRKRDHPWTCNLYPMDYTDKGYHERKPHSGCNPLRHRSVGPYQMVCVVFFSLDKSTVQVRDQKDTCDQISGHGQQRNRADAWHRLRWDTHCEGVFFADGDTSVVLRVWQGLQVGKRNGSVGRGVK